MDRKSAHRLGDGGDFSACWASRRGLCRLGSFLRLVFRGTAVHQRVRRRRLHRVHAGSTRSVIGCAPGGRILAAVMACGPDALLSHRSAAHLWGLGRDHGAGSIDVTAPNRRGRVPAGISAHRSGSLRRWRSGRLRPCSLHQRRADRARSCRSHFCMAVSKGSFRGRGIAAPQPVPLCGRCFGVAVDGVASRGCG